MLQTYLFTRRWQRDQQAEADERLADELELHGAMSGVKGTDAQKVTKELRARAKRLREPEWSDDAPIEERADLTDAQRSFYARGRA